MPRNGAIGGGPFVITQNIRETDWKSVVEYLINLGKKLGSGSAAAAALENWLGLWAALHNFFQIVAVDLRNGRVKSPRNDSPPNNSGIIETSGEPSQGDSNSVYET